MLNTIVVSKGIGIGKAYIVEKTDYEISKSLNNSKEEEFEALDKGVSKTKIQLEEIKDKALKNIGKDVSDVFDAHLMFLEDPEYMDKIKNYIIDEKIKAEYAIQKAGEEFADMMEAIDDEYFKERAQDVRDVSNRVIKNILGVNVNSVYDIDEDVVLIANELTPSETAVIDISKVKGFATEIGGKTSHTAIIANNMGLPAMVNSSKELKNIKNGDTIIIDCIKNKLIVNPSKEILKKYKSEYKKYEMYIKGLEEYKLKDAITKDGKKIKIEANIAMINDVKSALEYGAESIGLFRTEFIYMNRTTFPTEEEQFLIYKEVLEKMDGKVVTIRTFDVGGDKNLSYYDMPDEMNPAMGYRAIRICLDDIELFKTQLKAILRASYFGNCRIMFPMISSIDEIRKVKIVLGEIKKELTDKKIPFDKNIKIGIMVEIPSVAVNADMYADEVDFFSIGTNDLTQYTLAVDRMNGKVSDIYDSLNPGVLKLISYTIKAAIEKNINVGMCGEMAGDALVVPYLIGLGINELSMNNSSMPLVKMVISKLATNELDELVKKIEKLKTSQEIKQVLKTYLKDMDIKLF